MGISEQEWQELLALEYVLTWRYSDDEESDTIRYKSLSKRKWDYGFNFNVNECYKKLIKKT